MFLEQIIDYKSATKYFHQNIMKHYTKSRILIWEVINHNLQINQIISLK